MNIYLDQICVTASMVKQAGQNELRDTAIIGTTGVGTGMIANHINNKMGHNGEEAMAAANAGGSLLSNAKSIMKAPGKALGAIAKSPGFRKGLKIGAVGGAIGLAGDYAAVKINKALEKKAMENKYIAHIAQNKISKEEY